MGAMPKTKQKKFYAVKKGRVTGIFNTWAKCEEQVRLFIFGLKKCTRNGVNPNETK